jgi:hypothetical protein
LRTIQEHAWKAYRHAIFFTSEKSSQLTKHDKNMVSIFLTMKATIFDTHGSSFSMLN